ncbi:hypothetical protein SAMN05421858_3264 [Haladaptatus litoreus]|uniref:Blue (type 1) copper domain-containing protein n=1 Tax=Haladaptatus litoreus TaxID=553468 RepID=A0A1N7CUD4_9EURY|nr:hypothetical protein SAMN05421858_3264 [Haladaptatus litoreus]
MKEHDSTERQQNRRSRRTLLKVLGGASIGLSTVGLVTGQDDDGNGENGDGSGQNGDRGGQDGGENGQSGDGNGDRGNGSQQNQRVILFGAQVSGWEGRLPGSIENEQNPSLELEPGTRYKVAWINRDGKRHQLQILDDSGNVLEETESGSERGANRSVTFTATRQMRQYRCRYHPQSMQGEVERQS